jgi:hypothetical protein
MMKTKLNQTKEKLDNQECSAEFSKPVILSNWKNTKFGMV